MPHRPVLLIALGAVFWLSAALGLRLLGPVLLADGMVRVLAYAAAFPLLLGVILVAQRIAGFGRADGFAAVSVITMAALLCDGIAVAWAPWLYGVDDGAVRLASAYVLWGGGVGLLVALLRGPLSPARTAPRP